MTDFNRNQLMTHVFNLHSSLRNNNILDYVIDDTDNNIDTNDDDIDSDEYMKNDNATDNDNTTDDDDDEINATTRSE